MLTPKEISQFCNLPLADILLDQTTKALVIDKNAKYGYASCHWFDVAEYKSGYEHALLSKNHQWKCYVDTFDNLFQIYLSVSALNEELQDEIPEDNYDEDECFFGNCFFILDSNNNPIQIFMASNNGKFIQRDLTIVTRNCPKFVWNF
jgi:hypothetical protein